MNNSQRERFTNLNIKSNVPYQLKGNLRLVGEALFTPFLLVQIYHQQHPFSAE